MATPWQHPRTCVFYYRRAVPADLRPFLGRYEFKESLRTRDPSLAKELFLRAGIKCERSFAAARQKQRLVHLQRGRDLIAEYFDYRRAHDVETGDTDVELTNMLMLIVWSYRSFFEDHPGRNEAALTKHLYGLTIGELEVKFESWAADRADFGWELVPVDIDDARLRADLAFRGLTGDERCDMSGMEEYGRELCRHLLAKRNFQPIVAHVEIIASFHGLCLRPSTPEFDGLAGALLEHLSTTYRPGEENMATLLRPVISPRLTAQPEQPPQSQSASPNRSTASAEAATQAESVQEPAYTVRDAFETWCRQKKATHKLKLDWGLAVSRWEKLHGLKPIAEITSKDVKRYRNTLTLLPARAPADLAARPFLEQIEIADEEDLPRLANQTVNKSLSCIRVMLEHAVDEEIIESNVAASVKGLDRDEEPRAQFEDAELKKIFYWLTKPTGERSTVGGTDLLETDEGLWVPTLALHGMRLREILQLRVEDICVEDGFHHMVVRHKPRRQQSTKTKASRLVPIHSRIREAGFLDFVDERRRSRAAWVFARTERDGAEQLAKEFSRQFGRFLDGTVGISDPDKVFHSFRHTFKALCRRAKMSEEIHDKLTGHSGGGTGRRYGAMTSLDVLDDAVQTVTLDMIDWSAFSANGCL